MDRSETSQVLARKLAAKELELERVKHELAGREARLRAIFDAEPECVKLLAADGSLLDMNPAGLRMLEADSLDQVSNVCIYPQVVEEYRASFRELTESVFRGESGTLEFQLAGLKGGRCWLETHAAPVRDATGAITALIAVTRDITERKRAEEETHARDERHLRQRDALIALTSTKAVYADGLASVLETITDCAARTLKVARVSVWRYHENHSALRCVDLYELAADRHSAGAELSAASHPAYFLALQHLDVIAADDARIDPRTSEFAENYLDPLGITAMLDAAVQMGGVPDGVLCCEHVGSMRVWKEDEIVFALATANLVSLALEGWERHRAEIELREAQSRLHRAVIAGNVGLWDWDLVTNRIDYSAQWKRQLGYDEHEVSSAFDEWQSRLHPDDLERSLHTVQSYLDHPGPLMELEARLRHKDGSYRQVLSRGSLLRNEAGVAVRMLGASIDMTEHAQLQAQLLQSQKMESVGQLAGGIAHDFNNLLTVINGTADLVLSDVKAGDPLRADLLQIRDAGDRAASLTGQLLAFSRKQILQPDVIDLNTVLSDMQGMLQRLIGEHIDLVLVPAKTLGSVRADRGQIEQVVMNLAVNARDAMPEGGALTIETHNVELGAAEASDFQFVTSGPHVALTVSDAGVGMDEPTRARIFEPFFTTKGPGRGTGLGLSTVYGIVKQSGGNVSVSSEPGQGSTFTILLPQIDETARRVQTGRRPASRGTETVLVVEDEASVRTLTTRILHAAGYTVVTASSGVEALSLLKDHDGPVQLMLTDLVMPGMTGRDLAERLATSRPQMKVLYMSGHTDDAILRHGVFDDSAQFIGKPYTVAQLTQKVRDVLDSSGRGLAGSPRND